MKQWFLTHRYGLTVALVAAMILLPFLGAAPLMDPDEPVYGETAREMLLAGDWLSPRIFGQYWYDKPPLFYWLEMLSYLMRTASSARMCFCITSCFTPRTWARGAFSASRMVWIP